MQSDIRCFAVSFSPSGDEMTGKSTFFRQPWLAALVAMLGLGLASPGLGDDRNADSQSQRIVIKTQMNKTECTCRMAGMSLPVGSEVCIQNMMFRCQMDQNVTSWRALAAPCPQS
jgi:hypothetical protein